MRQNYLNSPTIFFIATLLAGLASLWLGLVISVLLLFVGGLGTLTTMTSTFMMNYEDDLIVKERGISPESFSLSTWIPGREIDKKSNGELKTE